MSHVFNSAGAMMYERFTDKSLKVLKLANQEALSRGQDSITLECLIVGLIEESSGVAVHCLRELNVDFHQVRVQIEENMPLKSELAAKGKLPMTKLAKKAIDLSIEEGDEWGHDFVGTEHILLGILRANELDSGEFLEGFGLSSNEVREVIVKLLASS